MQPRFRGTSSTSMQPQSASPALVDSFNRSVRYLRLSVTDRCNYRCFYCLPSGSHEFASCSERLNADELSRLAGLFVDSGVKHVRLTGGEPLLRPDLNRIAVALRDRGVTDLSLSTNGHLLVKHAVGLRESGVGRVNVSLDSLRSDVFSSITGGGNLPEVLRGIEAARAAGMSPIKINMVVMAGINDAEIEAMFDFARARNLELRFIETMPIGTAGRDVAQRHYPAERILQRLNDHAGNELIPVPSQADAGPARHYQIGPGPARVGLISALSRHFCDNCNRVRLTATGNLVLCLGADAVVPLGQELRSGAGDAVLRTSIQAAIAMKPAGHHFSSNEAPLRPMSAFGG